MSRRLHWRLFISLLLISSLRRSDCQIVVGVSFFGKEVRRRLWSLRLTSWFASGSVKAVVYDVIFTSDASSSFAAALRRRVCART